LVVRARLEDHWIVANHVRPASRTRPPARGTPSPSRFTLTVQQQPVRAVLEAVAAQTDRQLVIDEGIVFDDQARTSFSVTDADGQEVLDAIVNRPDWVAEIDQQTIRIRPRTP